MANDYCLKHEFKDEYLIITLLELDDQGDYVIDSIQIKRDEFLAWLKAKDQSKTGDTE